MVQHAPTPAREKKVFIMVLLQAGEQVAPLLKRPNRMQYCNKQLIQKKKAPQIVL